MTKIVLREHAHHAAMLNDAMLKVDQIFAIVPAMGAHRM
jgi:hypothetical protein